MRSAVLLRQAIRGQITLLAPADGGKTSAAVAVIQNRDMVDVRERPELIVVLSIPGPMRTISEMTARKDGHLKKDWMMTEKEKAKVDFVKDLSERVSREICDKYELNEQEKDAAAVQVSVCVLSCALADKTDAVKLKILGIVFDSALDFAKKLEKEAENGISE